MATRSLLWMATLSACVWTTHPPPERGPQTSPPGEPAALPAGGALHTMDRHQLRSAMTAVSEHVRVYNVWATWCAPCLAEMPALEAFDDAHPEVELWFVNADHPKVATRTLPRFLEDRGLDDRRHIRPPAGELDITGEIPDFPQVLPTTVVVSPAGSETSRFVGAVDEATLRRATAP